MKATSDCVARTILATCRRQRWPPSRSAWSQRLLHVAVASFGGVPHRLEVVRVLDGVTYVNDSASTAPVAGVGSAAQLHRANGA